MAALIKTEVTAGVCLVDAPALGLQVLCGCPADVVKHLIKHGLIVSAERNGVQFETGPDAILLSDLALQNGQFANAAEFPALQMFYRQGLIVPGHPNNTGAKPLLIGARDQLDAQLRYIYRGNYGLVSEAEIIEAGVDAAAARDLFRLKLRFAFGEIRHPNELFDAVYLEDRPVTLRGELSLRRTGINKFEFALHGETVGVDLNLPAEAQYAVPYELPMQQLNREYFAVVHCGDGDGWDANRPAMGSILMFQGRTYLVDAGANIHASLDALGIGVNEIEGLFHTHAHDDHFAGMTTLLRAGHRLKYFSTPLVRASVAKKLAALMAIDEEAFDDFFDARDLVPDVWNDVEGLQVKPLFSPHPVENSVYVFRALWEGGWRSYAHFADIASFDVLESMVVDDPDKPGISRTMFDRVRADYATPADVKKLDIGGGLIHGRALDFLGDKSERIFLSHIARPLTDSETSIGSVATFGEMNVLIPGNQDYLLRNAFYYLQAYFSQVPVHQLRILLNAPLAAFAPRDILVAAGEINQDIYLVLTGMLEMVDSGARATRMISAGSLVGEASGLSETPSSVTYRAKSHVHALRLPGGLYREFVRSNALDALIARLQSLREFLRRTWLFGEGVSDPTLNRIASFIKQTVVAEDETFDPKSAGLIMAFRGTGQVAFGEEAFGSLRPGEFIGAGTVLYGTASLFSVRAATRLEILAIPADVLVDIPVIRWKLLESHARWLQWLSESDRRHQGALRWDESYQVGVLFLDNHHRRLLVEADVLARAIEAQRGREVVQEMFAALIQFARYHFEKEEECLRRFDYPGLERHCAAHQRLLTMADELLDHPSGIGAMNGADATTWLKEWIVSHILEEDRSYAGPLAARGAY